MRNQKQEALWKEFFSRTSAEQSLFEGAVLISQWAQINQEYLPSLAETEMRIDKIVQRVTDELMGSSGNQKSPKQILSFINQVLFQEIGQNGFDEIRENVLIDMVNKTTKYLILNLYIFII